jgi:hypothetical protein
VDPVLVVTWMAANEAALQSGPMTPARVGRIIEPPLSENGWRAVLDPEPERAEGEWVYFDWEEMTYQVVPEDVLWPEVPEERIEQWWQWSRGPLDRDAEAEVEALRLRNRLAEMRRNGVGLGFTAREMRMLEEIERLKKVLDPSRDRPGWGSRAWEPRPGEVGADGTRH